MQYNDRDKDIENLIQKLSAVLMSQNRILITAESCTGGLISAYCTEQAGSSSWFDRAYVTYSNSAKHQMLGVSLESLEQYGAVSRQVVEAMALGAGRQVHAQQKYITLAISGVAGPTGGTSEKPLGLIWLAWNVDGYVSSLQLNLESEKPMMRSDNRLESTYRALERALELLESA